MVHAPPPVRRGRRTFHGFTRDPSHDFGHWYHGHLTLTTPEGPYHAALDVDSPDDNGVAYRVVDGLTTADVAAVRALPDGFHPLASTPASGALDYVRSPRLQDAAWLAAPAALARGCDGSSPAPPPGPPPSAPTSSTGSPDRCPGGPSPGCPATATTRSTCCSRTSARRTGSTSSGSASTAARAGPACTTST
ncbi:DUF2278 family protein [Kitasatospora arboriphila]